MRAKTVKVRDMVVRASTTCEALSLMNSKAASVRLRDWGRSTEGRVKKEIRRVVWESWSMYEDVVAVSSGRVVPVTTKIVIDKLGWCCKISFPNSTMDTMWWKPGAPYNTTMLFFILIPLSSSSLLFLTNSKPTL